METIKCIKERRTIRQYKDKDIPKEILMDLIGCARLAPSANNKQPWEFIVVTDKERLREIASYCPYGSFIKDAGACVIVLGDKENKHSIEDCCIASTNIILSAWDYGIGSCWVAAYKKEFTKPIQEIIGMPDKFEIISILSLGYPARKVEPHDKRGLDELIHWENF